MRSCAGGRVNATLGGGSQYVDRPGKGWHRLRGTRQRVPGPPAIVKRPGKITGVGRRAFYLLFLIGIVAIITVMSIFMNDGARDRSDSSGSRHQIPSDYGK